MKKDLSPTLYNDLRDKAEEIEGEKQGFHERAFSLRLFSMFSLPYTNPHSEKIVRTNGDVTFIVQCPSEFGGVPYGVYPRIIQYFMETEMIRKQYDIDPNDPVIETGASLIDFLEKLGVSKGGKTTDLILKQLEAYSGTTFHAIFRKEELRNKIWLVGKEYDSIKPIRSYEVFYDKKSPSQKTLFAGNIKPDSAYFKATVSDKKSMPLDIRIIRALQGSPLRMDIYRWLTARSYGLTKESAPIDLKPLTRNQFGLHYKRPSDEQKLFFKELKKVLALCPQFGVRTIDEGLILLPPSKE